MKSMNSFLGLIAGLFAFSQTFKNYDPMEGIATDEFKYGPIAFKNRKGSKKK